MSISEERCGKGFIGVHVHLTYDVEDTLTYNGAGFKVAQNKNLLKLPVSLGLVGISHLTLCHFEFAPL